VIIQSRRVVIADWPTVALFNDELLPGQLNEGRDPENKLNGTVHCACRRRYFLDVS
jgi:hypothetical protein